MELLSGFKELSIRENVKEQTEIGNLRKRSKTLNIAKQELKANCNIIFLNVITETNNKFTVNVKTIENSYIYDYNFDTKEIKLIGGIRKNACITKESNTRRS